MKNALVAVALGLLAAVLVGCSGSLVPGAEMTEEGTVVFVAEGSSVIARSGDTLSVLEAQTAARTIALANLLAKVKGAQVAGTETVADLMFESQKAVSAVEGSLSRVHVSYEQPEAEGDEAQVVTAVATLELNRWELARLAQYVK